MKNNKIITCLLALLLAFCLSSCGMESGGAEESDVRYIKEKGVLSVGVMVFDPMNYLDNDGEWTGFDTDNARKIAKELGVDVNYVYIDWGKRFELLEDKTIDCVWNGMSLTEKVKNSCSYTVPYCRNAQVVVFTTDRVGDYKSLDDMKNLTFTMEAGTTAEDTAIENGLNYTTLSTQAEALAAVSARECDACIVDSTLADSMTGKGTAYPDLAYEIEMYEDVYVVGCRMGSDLPDFINTTMKKLYRDRVLQANAKNYGLTNSLLEPGKQ